MAAFTVKGFRKESLPETREDEEFSIRVGDFDTPENRQEYSRKRGGRSEAGRVGWPVFLRLMCYI